VSFESRAQRLLTMLDEAIRSQVLSGSRATELTEDDAHGLRILLGTHPDYRSEASPTVRRAEASEYLVPAWRDAPPTDRAGTFQRRHQTRVLRHVFVLPADLCCRCQASCLAELLKALNDTASVAGSDGTLVTGEPRISDLVVVSQPKLQLAARETNRGKKLVSPPAVRARPVFRCFVLKEWVLTEPPSVDTLGCRHVEQIRKIFQTPRQCEGRIRAASYSLIGHRELIIVFRHRII